MPSTEVTLVTPCRQLLGEGRERNERDDGGKLGETQRTTHKRFVWNSLAGL